MQSSLSKCWKHFLMYSIFPDYLTESEEHFLQLIIKPMHVSCCKPTQKLFFPLKYGILFMVIPHDDTNCSGKTYASNN